MTDDPKITDTLLYGEGASFVWDEDWIVSNIENAAVQFRRRPRRARYVERPIMVRTLELEDA